MITQKMRPQTFSEVAGQDLNKKILKAIVKNPQEAPKSIILQGFFGCGKTSLARIFARALNCENPQNGEPCGKCSNCIQDIDSCYYYQEYDAAVVGNVDNIRELRDTFYYKGNSGWKVVVLDEAHIMSKTSQSALLKVIEDTPQGVIFIFATTHVQDLLPTIVSRSLELRFELIGADEIIRNLKEVSERVGKPIPSDKVLSLIANRSGGHMRNAHMLLDKYFLVGEQDFIDTVKSARDLLLKFFISIFRKDYNLAMSSLSELGTFPLADVKKDYEATLLEILKCYLKKDYTDKLIETMIMAASSNVLQFVKLCMSKWVMDAFDTDPQFQCAMLVIYQMINKTSASPANNQTTSVYNQKAMNQVRR